MLYLAGDPYQSRIYHNTSLFLAYTYVLNDKTKFLVQTFALKDASLTTHEAAWDIISVLSVCVSDNNFRKS